MISDKPVGHANGWKQLAQEVIYSCPWFRLRKDQVELQKSGSKITYSYMDHEGSVFVVPVTRQGEVVLIRSYRYTVDEWCWGVPSGCIFDKKGKSLEDCAREEMFEEAGCSGGSVESLGWFFTAFGIMSLKAHIFLAREVEVGANQPEPGESIDRILKVPMEEIGNWISSGAIRDGESALALQLAIGRLGATK